MAVQTYPSTPFDINNITGPTRAVSPVITRAGSITPGTNYGEVAKGIFVGTTGNLSVILPDGSTVVFNSLPAGQVFWVATLGVNVSGTTASNLVWVS